MITEELLKPYLEKPFWGGEPIWLFKTVIKDPVDFKGLPAGIFLYHSYNGAYVALCITHYMRKLPQNDQLIILRLGMDFKWTPVFLPTDLQDWLERNELDINLIRKNLQ